MSEGTKAQPDEITTFGREVQEQSTQLMEGYGTHMTGAMTANVGASGFPEAALMRSRYASMTQAAVAFTQDSSAGLLALSYASMTVAQNYREGDSDQQVLMNGVDAAFTPAPGQDSIAGQQRRAAAGASRARAEEDRLRRQMGEDPADDWDDGYRPTVTSPAATAAPGVVTPSQQVRNHDDRAAAEGYDEQERDYDPQAEAAAAAAAEPTPTSQPAPTPTATPTSSAPSDAPSVADGPATPAAASPGPSPSPAPPN